MASLFNRIPYKSSSAYTLVFVLCALLYSNLHFEKWHNGKVIEWDVTSYYGYLPAAFIHEDIALDFIEKDRNGYAHAMQFWPETAENGGKVFKMTMGLAILYSPFFGLAHLIAKTFGYAADGFSLPYHICIHFSCLAYSILGFTFLRKLLLIFFQEHVTSMVMIILALGTNLLYYSSIEAAMSHAYSFSLISIFLYTCFKWHNKVSLSNTLTLGLIGGLIILIRPINMLIFIVPCLLYVSSYKDLWARINFMWGHKLTFGFIALLVLLVLSPQLLYWKYVTGHFYFYSYGDEHFYFNNPHIVKGLFGYRKGWLVYTPMMGLSLIGFYALYKIQRALFWGILVFTVLNIFVVFSWWCWWYGGGFGLRAMIDSYPLLAIPMAAFFQMVFNAKYKILTPVVVLIAGFFIYLNIFQTIQYKNALIHYDSMSKNAYWMNFLEDEDIDWRGFEKALVHPDYEKAIKGEDE